MKKSKKKSNGENPSLPIGIVPNWLLKAETGKGLWEHLIPDEEYRESVLRKIKERSQWSKGELFYEKNF
jgi:hypothetical protein